MRKLALMFAGWLHTLQQKWDHEADAHLGSIIIAPNSHKKVRWSSGIRNTGQPHRWQAQICNCTGGKSCPYDVGRAVCPCNDLVHNHPEVAAEWDWEANGERTPETVASSSMQASWKSGLCGHCWSATVQSREDKAKDAPSVGVRLAAI